MWQIQDGGPFFDPVPIKEPQPLPLNLGWPGAALANRVKQRGQYPGSVCSFKKTGSFCLGPGSHVRNLMTETTHWKGHLETMHRESKAQEGPAEPRLPALPTKAPGTGEGFWILWTRTVPAECHQATQSAP